MKKEEKLRESEVGDFNLYIGNLCLSFFPRLRITFLKFAAQASEIINGNRNDWLYIDIQFKSNSWPGFLRKSDNQIKLIRKATGIAAFCVVCLIAALTSHVIPSLLPVTWYFRSRDTFGLGTLSWRDLYRHFVCILFTIWICYIFLTKFLYKLVFYRVANY